MKVVVLEVCRKEILKFPKPVIAEFFELISDLEEGLTLSMPVSTKMEGIGKGANELRVKDKTGIYRTIYFIKKGNAIYLVHAFKKKSQKTPKKNLDLARRRGRSVE